MEKLEETWKNENFSCYQYSLLRSGKMSVIRAYPMFCRSQILLPAVEVWESISTPKPYLKQNIIYCTWKFVKTPLEKSWNFLSLRKSGNPDSVLSPIAMNAYSEITNCCFICFRMRESGYVVPGSGQHQEDITIPA